MREINLEIVGKDLKEKLGIKDIDIKPIVDGLSNVSKAVKDKKFDKVDTKNIEKLLKVISDKKQDNSDVINAINDLVEVLNVGRNEQDYSDKFDALITATNNMPQLFRPAYNSYNPQIRDKNENIINPATEETLQSIIESSWVSSNIDIADATYYYFLSFIPTTTKWRINRLNKTSYVSDYATGDSSISTAWTDRATQTYATIY